MRVAAGPSPPGAKWLWTVWTVRRTLDGSPVGMGGWRLERSMWWFIIGLLALIVVVAIVVSRRGSTAAHDLSSDHHPDTSMGGANPH